MATSIKSVMVLLLALACAGCQKNPKLGTLSIDLYLHPESGTPEDLLLEAAIRKNLNDNESTRKGIYARVLDLRVVLSGTVASAAASGQAEKLANDTRVTVNEKVVAPKGVTNLLKIEQ
jgi:hypothetical protein